MVPSPKVFSVLSCTFVLGLGLSHTALALETSVAPDEIRAEQNTERKGNLPGLIKQDEETRNGIHTMKGALACCRPSTPTRGSRSLCDQAE